MLPQDSSRDDGFREAHEQQLSPGTPGDLFLLRQASSPCGGDRSLLSCRPALAFIDVGQLIVRDIAPQSYYLSLPAVEFGSRIRRIKSVESRESFAGLSMTRRSTSSRRPSRSVFFGAVPAASLPAVHTLEPGEVTRRKASSRWPGSQAVQLTTRDPSSRCLAATLDAPPRRALGRIDPAGEEIKKEIPRSTGKHLAARTQATRLPCPFPRPARVRSSSSA